MGEGHTDAAVMARSCRLPSNFSAIFDRHFDAIYSYLRRRLGAQLAEDLAAQTFEEAFRLRARYDPTREDARPWLYGIATNLVRNHLRQERRRLMAYSRFPTETASADEVDVAVSRADARALAPDVARALESLTPADRDTLLLLAWAQLSYSEISEALDIPIGTVRSRLSRARMQVRELIGQSGQYLDEDDIVRNPRKGIGHG
jgi:RNA polymerase sigma factor (sigma-70 family)